MPKKVQIWPENGIFVHFWPGLAGSFGWWLWCAGCISQDTYLLYINNIQDKKIFSPRISTSRKSFIWKQYPRQTAVCRRWVSVIECLIMEHPVSTSSFHQHLILSLDLFRWWMCCFSIFFHPHDIMFEDCKIYWILKVSLLHTFSSM